MPPFDVMMDETQKSEKLKLRELLYGPPKFKKTWWLANAATAGFNVIILNGDDGAHIIKNIAQEHRKRIQVVDLVIAPGKSVMSEFMATFLKGEKFCWDEQDKKIVLAAQLVNLEHSHYWIDASKLTLNDVLGVDSYTQWAMDAMMRGALDINLDISEVDKADRDSGKMRDLYNYAGNYLTWGLNRLKSLNSHVVVIGHQTQYEKRDKNGRDILWTRTQVVSSSGPHGLTIGQHFSDILRFYMVGDQFKIDTSPKNDMEGGSRLIAPKQCKWEDLQFIDICHEAGVPIPQNPEPPQAFKWYPAGTVPDELQGSKVQVGNVPLSTQQTGAVKINTGAKGGTFASMLAKQKQG